MGDKVKICLLVLNCRTVWGEIMTDGISDHHAWIEKLKQIGIFSQNFHKADEQIVSRAAL